eukprot:TRINITY_DN17_c0_g2_i1.p1 TRINITY_DN17_c0_g2~~TRINITY_DN17_c0_g2_i1.p1  ORF type:complete len:912 (+),score=114.75 TRINITY_DN17_c0_g2_i1:1513-4248(+)
MKSDTSKAQYLSSHKHKGTSLTSYFVGNVSTTSLVRPATELGEQSRKMLSKLIPLIQLCKDKEPKPSVKPSHKKSFSISHAQPSMMVSTKKPNEPPKNSVKVVPNYALQAETVDCRSGYQKPIRHARTKSEIVKPTPSRVEAEHKSQAKLLGKSQKDNSMARYYKKEDTKPSVTITTPPSPVSALKKDSAKKVNTRPTSTKRTQVVEKKPCMSHKRSVSDGSMVAKKIEKPNEPAKPPVMRYKNIAPTRPVSSTGNFGNLGKKPVPSFGWAKPERPVHHEKSISSQFLLNSFGKFVGAGEGKSLLEEFRKGKCVVKNTKNYNNVTTFVKKVGNEKENDMDKSVAIKVTAKLNTKSTGVSVPYSKRQSVVHSPKKEMKTIHGTDVKEKVCNANKAPTVMALSSENLNKLGHQKDMEKLVNYITTYFKQHKEAPPTTTEFYRIGRLLGKGAFGKVNLGMHKLTGKMVAIKSINKECFTDESSKKKVMQEFSILKLMRHSSVIRLYETFESKKHILFIIELCAGGDLLNYVRKRRRLKEMTAKFVFYQLINGLNYCHSKGILHRDIKLDNILLNAVGDIKICDFGVSKCVKKGEKMFEQCGTPAYIAPEILRGKGYEGFGVDIWSAGVALYAILYGTVPFKSNDMKSLQKDILKGKYSLKDDISLEARDLLRRMLELDPKKRISGAEILAHPWMQQAFDPRITLFTEAEKEAIRKEYSCVKKSNTGTDTNTLFTEQNIDSTLNDLTKNMTTKSVILAPFNTSRNSCSSIQAPIVDKKMAIKFSAKVRDIDRQYEKNNNGEVDNGVYNKFAEEGRSESNDSLNESFEEGGTQYSGLLEGYDKTASTQATIVKYHAEREKEQTEKIDEEVLKKVETLGYPRGYVLSCLNEGKMNYATTAYYLLVNNIQLLLLLYIH